MELLELESQLAAEFGVVAVLDDDYGQARTLRLELEELGIEALVADLDDVPTLEQAVEWVRSSAAAVVCDVQLGNLHPGIGFNGAQLVARLVAESQIPCVLVTGFPADVGMVVRPYRAQIPVLFGRDETEDPQLIVDGLRRCRNEMEHGRGPERATHRVPLFVEKVSAASEGVALDARVGGWTYRAAVRFPATMVDSSCDDVRVAEALIGKVFFARANIGAERDWDIFFEEPEPQMFDPTGLELHFEAEDD